LRKKSQRAEVDAQNGNARARHIAGSREESPVTTEHYDKIRLLLYQVFPLRLLPLRPELARNRVYRDCVAMRDQPVRNIAYKAGQLRLTLLGDDGGSFHQNSACSRTSRFPSPPRMGESITSSLRPPSDSTAERIFSTAVFLAVSSRTMPPLPTSSLPTSNCGLIRTTASFADR